MNKALVAMVLFGVLLVSFAFAGTSVFKNIVTKPVLEKAISELASDLKGEHSYTKHYGLTWSAGVYARHAVFEKEMGNDYKKLYASLAANFNDPENYWVKKGGAKKSVLHLYEKIMSTARSSLQDPNVLKALYLSHKDEAIALIHKHDIVNELKSELATMLPYFDGTLDSRTAELCESRRVAWQTWVAGGNFKDLYSIEAMLQEKHQLSDRNFNYYEWPLRRMTEGGQQLVDMWAWVIKDMVSSL